MGLSRRKALAGLFLAPAIIRTPGLLMPIKPSLVAPLGLYITAAMIAQEFAQEMYRAGSRRAIMPHFTQKHVDLLLSSSDRRLPMKEFVEKHLRPAAMALSAQARGVGGPLDLPKGIDEGALAVAGGFGVRFVSFYDPETDSKICRFDVIS